MNVLILGERDFRKNFNSQKYQEVHSVQWMDEEWKTMIDPVVCEEKLENTDCVIHTGVCNYNYTSQGYEELILPLQSLVDHTIENGITFIYISDIQAKNKSPRDQSYEYLHHLAEREICRMIQEGGKAWIVRPSFILNEIPSSKFGRHINKMESPYVVTEDDILSLVFYIIDSSPSELEFELTGSKISIQLLMVLFQYESSRPGNFFSKIFTKPIEWVDFKSFTGPFSDKIPEGIKIFDYMKPEIFIQNLLARE